MANPITFLQDELEELREFYRSELTKAEQRVISIKSIISKLGKSSNKKKAKTASGNTAISIENQLKKEAKIAIIKGAKKRGRPAKLNEQVKPKGKRGRPAKQVNINAVNKLKGKRGRPAKIENSNAAIEPKGKRGRPAKQVNTNSVDKPKGKRGRPSKVNSTVSIKDLKDKTSKHSKSNTTDLGIVVLKPGKRGRPSKVVVSQAQVKIKPVSTEDKNTSKSVRATKKITSAGKRGRPSKKLIIKEEEQIN
jgi:hypothetical protein